MDNDYTSKYKFLKYKYKLRSKQKGGIIQNNITFDNSFNTISYDTVKNYIIPLDLLKSKSYYPSKEAKKQGWVRWSLSKLYNGTFGYFSTTIPEIAEGTPLVSVSYLKVFYLIVFLVLMEASIIKA